MRTIKFRCWDTGINFMYYDPDCYNIYNEEDNGLHSGYEDKYGMWHQNKLMQYTGLKDKNGVEIYEGDVVTIKGDERKFYIRWFDDMCFAFADVRSDYVKTFYSCYDTSNGFPLDEWIEVIGNIYKHHYLPEENHD